MPLVFIHGVNTRNTDKDYARSMAARRTMFEELVAPAVRKKGFPKFAVADDIYWGDLGVTFGWNLKSVPATHVLESLGAAGDQENLDVLQLVSEAGADERAPQVEKLGASQPLVAAARQAPGKLVRSIFAPEANRFAQPEVRPPAAPVSPVEAEKARAEGAHLGFILLAVEDVARALDAAPGTLKGQTDAQILDEIEQRVVASYQELAKPYLAKQQSAGTGPATEDLGAFSDAIGWASDHIKAAFSAAKEVATTAVAKTARGTSLLALKGVRDGLSRRALRFLGDAFVYLHQGPTGAISERVKKGVLALNGKVNEKKEREPFIVVTHSFGSEILYDLLTSHALDGVTIDLWITAGAQTSLFAEMRLFETMAAIPADTSKFTLGVPSNVKKWINFYDAADVLSYIHAPVFGEAVIDIEVRAQANLTNAHGHYFVDAGFYERIASEL